MYYTFWWLVNQPCVTISSVLHICRFSDINIYEAHHALILSLLSLAVLGTSPSFFLSLLLSQCAYNVDGKPFYLAPVNACLIRNDVHWSECCICRMLQTYRQDAWRFISMTNFLATVLHWLTMSDCLRLLVPSILWKVSIFSSSHNSLSHRSFTLYQTSHNSLCYRSFTLYVVRPLVLFSGLIILPLNLFVWNPFRPPLGGGACSDGAHNRFATVFPRVTCTPIRCKFTFNNERSDDQRRYGECMKLFGS